jgi:hypothetical protein
MPRAATTSRRLREAAYPATQPDCRSGARDFGFDRAQASRGLAALAEARLVSVEQAPGQKPLVTILDGADPGAAHKAVVPADPVETTP